MAYFNRMHKAISTRGQIPLPGVIAVRLQALGIDVAQLLHRAGLPQDALSNGIVRVNTPALFAILRNLDAMSAQPDLGLRIGSESLPSQLDVASIAALHSRNLQEALERLARYKRLVCPEEITVQRMGDEAMIEFRWDCPNDPMPNLLIDATCASTLSIAGAGIGRAIKPRRVELNRQPRHKETLEQFFKCPVFFNATVDRLVLDAELLAIPFITHNPDLQQIILPGLDAQLKELPASRNDADSLISKVRHTIRLQLQGRRASLDVVAQKMFMSVRTLQRKLNQADTSYQTLLDEVRREVAFSLLRSSTIDVSEITFLLGYEEVNSFNRAFRGWANTSPALWRAQNDHCKHSNARSLPFPLDGQLGCILDRAKR
jgi:AraC-like DNA-binding protein